MSLKQLGSLVTILKQLNKLSKDQRKVDNPVYANILKAFSNEDDPKELAKKLKKHGMSAETAKDVLTDIGRTSYNEHFDDKQGYIAWENIYGIGSHSEDEKQTPKNNQFSDNELPKFEDGLQNVKQASESAGESIKKMNDSANFDKAGKSATKFSDRLKNQVGTGVEKVRTKVLSGVEKTRAKLGSLRDSVKNVGVGAKQLISDNLPTVIMALGTAAAYAVNGLANSIRKDQLTAGQKNLDKYTKKINKNQSKVDSVNDIKAEFNRLSKGVDNTTNENVGLSETDYKRYLELKQQLVKVNKDLVKSTNSEGQSIIDNNTAIDKTIDKYEKLVQKNKEAVVSKKNLAIQNKAASANVDKITNGSQIGDRSLMGNVGRILSGGKNSVGLGGALIGGAIGTLIAPGTGTAAGAVIGASVQDVANLIGASALGTSSAGAIHSLFASKKSIKSEGLKSNKENMLSMIKNNSTYFKEAQSVLGIKKKSELDNLTDQQLSTLVNNANFDGGGLFGAKDNVMSKYVDGTKSNLKDLTDYLKDFKDSTLSNVLEASSGFATLDKTSQEFAKSYVSNMDLDSSKIEGKGATKYLEEQEQKVRSFTTKLATDSSLKDAYQKFTDIKGDTSKTGAEWQKQINAQFDILKKKTGASAKELSGMLGVSLSGDNVLTSNGQNVQKMVQTLNDKFKDQQSKQQKAVNKLNKKDDFAKLVSDYQTQRETRLSKGSSKQGNVDLNGRPVLLNKDKSYSTLLSSSMAGADGSKFEGKEIMYTPVLASSGKKLDEKTMQEYITQITSKASSQKELLKLDSKGLEINGQKVKNVIEGVADSVEDANKKTTAFHKDNEDGYTQEAESLQKIKNYLKEQGGQYADLGKKLNSSVDFDKIFGKGYFQNLSLDQLSEAYDLITDKNEIFTGSLDQLKARLDNIQKYKDSGLSLTLDDYNQAVKSADDDADYNTFVSGLKSAKEDWNKGKVGTDQFKDMAGLISPTGKTDDKNFKENYDHIIKYFTADDSGPKAFVSQLQNMTNASGEAMAKLDKKTGDYKVNIDNTAKAAKKMGMGVVPFESMLNNLKTYGWNVDFDSLSEQWDSASTKLTEWSQAWQKNGGSLGDAQGQEIEKYKQQLEEFRQEGEKLPDNWEKTLTIKVNVSEAETKLTNGIDEYEQKLKDNGKDWAQSDEGQKARQEVFDAGSEATDKANKAAKSMMKENGLKHNQKYNDALDKADDKVQSTLKTAKETGSKKDMEAYQKAIMDRQNLIASGATDNQYYYKTKFKNQNQVEKELKRNGVKIGKDGTITADSKADNKKDIEAIVKSYNKEHKGDEIQVKWADGNKPSSNDTDTKKKQTPEKNEQPKTQKEEKTSSKDKNSKLPGWLNAINNFFDKHQTNQNPSVKEKDKSKDYQKPAIGTKKDNYDKEDKGLKSWIKGNGQSDRANAAIEWLKNIPANIDKSYKDAQTKSVKTYQKPTVQSGSQNWQTNNTKYDKVVSSAKKFGGGVVSNAKSLGSSAVNNVKGIIGTLTSGIKGVVSKSSSTSNQKQGSQKSKSDITVNAKGNAKKTIDALKKSLSGMKAKALKIDVKGSAKKTISSISSALKKLKSKSISIKIKGGASAAINKVVNALKKVKNKTVTVKVKDSASSKINSIKNKLNALGKMHPTPKVTIDVDGLQDVQTASSTISGLHDKTVNVSVNYKQSGNPGKGSGDQAYGTTSFAHGSMCWSRAFAQGTVSDLTDFTDWDGEAFAHGSVRKLSSRALAKGDLGAKNSGKTLVGELGPEIKISSGSSRWELLGTTGPEFADIHSGDIVFNHQQTADLLSNGHTSTRASVKGGMSAFAHGKAFASGQSASLTGGWRGGIAESHSGSSHSSTTKKNTEATKKNTKAKDNDTKSTKKNTKKKTALEKYVDKLGAAFDFVAIKLDRAAAATEAFANKINDYVSSNTKTKALWNEYKSTGKEITANQKAAKKYKSYANSIERNAIAKAPGSGKTKTANRKKLRSYFKQVRNGSLNISTIKNDNMRSVVESYQQYYEKMLDCNKAAQTLKNTQRDLFNQWLNMPIEKAQKSIDARANVYNYLSARSSAASTGESGIQNIRDVYEPEVSNKKSNVDSKTAVRDKAKKADNSAQSKLNAAKSTQKKAKSTQKKSAKSTKKAINSQKGLSKTKKKSLSSKISKGQKISTKGLKGKAKKQATQYNKSVDAKKKADKSVKTRQSNKNKTAKTLKTAQSNLNTAKSELKAIQALQNEAVKSDYANKPAYEYQNNLLAAQVKSKEDDYKDQREAEKTAQKNYNTYSKQLSSAQKSKDKATKKVKSKQSTVKSKSKKILSSKAGKKQLTKSQQKKIKAGKTVNTKNISNKSLKKQLEAYNKAVKALNKAKSTQAAASKKVKTVNTKEKDALNALTTAQNNARQSAAELAQEKTNAAMQTQANIKAYYDAQQNYESIQGSNASSAAKLKQAKGEDLNTEDYQKQIDSNEKQAKLYEEAAKKMQENLDKQVKDGSIKEGSQEWMQMQGEIDACKGSADDLRSSNEELKNSMRDDIYYRGFERAIKAAQNLQNALTTISSLIDEDAMFDDDGNLTDYGTAAIATNIANVRSEKEELADLMAERAKMFEHRDEYSDTEWAEAIQKSDQDIADAVKSIKSAEDSVTSILKNNAKQKLDSINKTIDAYKEAIQSQKDYFSYDKQLKSSNKEIQILKSQIMALNGVADSASKAQKARLEAQLQEKQDALDDTVKDHIYQLQIDGLDKLSTQLNDDYEKYCKELSSSVEKIEETFTSLSGTITEEGRNIDGTIREILHHYGIDDPTAIGAPSEKITGFATGGVVKSVRENGDDGLGSLKAGEEVITVKAVQMSDRLVKNKTFKALADGNILNGITMDGIGNTEVSINFGDAIGNLNIPNGVSDEELQRIIKESYKYTSQQVARDVAKTLGRKRPV